MIRFSISMLNYVNLISAIVCHYKKVDFFFIISNNMVWHGSKQLFLDGAIIKEYKCINTCIYIKHIYI